MCPVQYRELPGCLSRGRRSNGQISFHFNAVQIETQVQVELHGCLSRGRCSTQSLLEELRRAWSPLGPRLPFAWQAQYTEPPGGAAARVVAAGAAAAFRVAGAVHRTPGGAAARVVAAGAAAAFRVAGAVHTQYTEPPGGAAARVGAAGAAAAFRGRRSTQSLRGRRSTQSLIILYLITCARYRTLRRMMRRLNSRGLPLAKELSAQSLHGRSSCFSLGSRRSCSRLRRRRLIITTHHSPLMAHHNFSSQLVTTHHTLSHTNSSQLHFSHLTHHSSTAHHNSSQLHF